MHSNTFVSCEDISIIPKFSHISLPQDNSSFRVFSIQLPHHSYQFSMSNEQYVDFLIELRTLINDEVDKHRTQEGLHFHESSQVV